MKSRRETRGTRRRDRAIAREAGALVRQDIFEVSDEGMPVEELANMLAVNPAEIVKALFMKGLMVQVNQVRFFDWWGGRQCQYSWCPDQLGAAPGRRAAKIPRAIIAWRNHWQRLTRKHGGATAVIACSAPRHVQLPLPRWLCDEDRAANAAVPCFAAL